MTRLHMIGIIRISIAHLFRLFVLNKIDLS